MFLRLVFPGHKIW